MARSLQISCPPGSVTSIAGAFVSIGGSVYIKNTHATESVLIGGDENELRDNSGGTTLGGTSGFALASGATLGPLVLTGHEMLYGRGATSTVSVTVAVFSVNSSHQL